MLESVYKFIIENISSGKIEKQTAIQLISRLKQEEVKQVGDIAIIGVSSLLPASDNIDEFWQNIHHNINCITGIPDSRKKNVDTYLNFINFPPEEIKYMECAYISEIDEFDYNFFRLSPNEANLMDPNHRLFLQVAWHAIEDAGYGGQKIVGSNTGIYVGYYNNLRDNYQKIISEVKPSDLPISMTGNLSAMLPSRLSYLLDLRGPTMVIDTACSSSLVAVDLACQAIKNGTCEMAIAAGIKVNTVPLDWENGRIGVESSDNRTRTFDDKADGSAVGEGIVAVLLKPLEKALEDGDHVYAVIKGSAINQDGTAISLTAPNPAAQTDVIIKAWENAGIDPTTISYIVAHGTATNLGDPIEIKSIQKAFHQYTDKKQFCAISTLKSKYGHLFEAAGITNLIHGMLALVHQEIPATIYFNQPNQAISFAESPVYVNTRPRKWETNGNPRRCGISAFGFSGTNCHLVLEEAPAVQEKELEKDQLKVLALSAKTENALREILKRYSQFIDTMDESQIDALCYTANTGRGHYNYRWVTVFNTRQDLDRKLESGLLAAQSTGDNDTYYGKFKVVAGNRETKESDEITEDEQSTLTCSARTKLEEYLETGKTQTPILKDLCRLYVQGAEIDWEEMYRGKKYRKLRAPVYPFEPSKCWIRIPERQVVAQDGPEDMFYSLIWRAEQLSPRSEAGVPAEPGVLATPGVPETLILFKDRKGIGEAIAGRFKADGYDIIEIEMAGEYRRVDSQHYIISDEETDYAKVIGELKEKPVSRIIHLASITGEEAMDSLESLDLSQRRNVFGLFYLTRALLNHGLDQNIELWVISEYVNEVTGEESRINPQNAPLFGIGKTINQENHGIRCRCIDIDEEIRPEDLILEMKNPGLTYLVSYRRGKRYVEEFREVAMENIPLRQLTLKDSGIYLITGGIGGLGLETAKYLATQKTGLKLALIGRSKFPSREEWDQILASEKDPKLCRRIRSVQEIESKGTEISIYSADVACMEEMAGVITSLRQKYGRINGVIHGAGVPGEGFMIRKTEAAFHRVFDPKVRGTWIIDHLTQTDELDFFVMFSSGLSILSEPGHSDYTAANSFLDSFAVYRKKRNVPTLTINWVAWKEAGMSLETGHNYDALFKAIPTIQAIQGFHEALNHDIHRVFIGEFNYNVQFVSMLDKLPFQLSAKAKAKLERFKQQAGIKGKLVREKTFQGHSEDLVLKGKDNQEFSATEKKVAQIYHELLGFGEINIYDNFFELGGDSILINRMLARMADEFPGKVRLIDLFTYTSIATLAQFIAASDEDALEQKSDQELDEFKEMFSAIEKGELSIDDVLKDLSGE
ncbi:MAG TPA: SDR family NAD(P)-dependent oxidoreductase [Bacillota bacterium]|nr:SDR family NAD(P)-dependent oxidoreductase [Bacillota bacterium]